VTGSVDNGDRAGVNSSSLSLSSRGPPKGDELASNVVAVVARTPRGGVDTRDDCCEVTVVEVLLLLDNGGVEVLLEDEVVPLEPLSPNNRSRLAADKDADAGAAESNREDPPSPVRDENKDWC